MGKRGLRLISLAAIPVLVFSACSSTAATQSTAPVVTPTAGVSTPVASTPVTPPGVVGIRWFIGLGSGTQPSQIAAQKSFIADYNANNKDNIKITDEIVPNANAYDVLKTEIAAGNAPDIIGPVGVKGRNGFEGLFLDLTSEIASQNFPVAAYDPTLISFFKSKDGQVGLPYDIFPGYIWYNKDTFSKYGVAPLPVKVGDQYQGKTWDWTALQTVAQQLTIDKTGKNSTQAGFDPNNIVKYGIDFQWADGRRMVSDFGAGSFVADDGVTAQIPDVWTAGFSWYYNAIWKLHIAPNGTAEASTLLGAGNSQSSGNVAMNAAWGWSISSIASDAKTSKVKAWDMAVVPSVNGVTTAGMDADTFTIAKASKNPDQAFKAMVAIMADPTLMKVYGGEPAKTADQAAYFTAFDATLAPIFPGNKVTWSVLGEMQKHAAVPSIEANMPNFTQASNDYGAFYTKLQNKSGLDVTAELSALKVTLQKDFDAVKSLG
jgi:multiple sugar transport system substrate-binding protein